MIRYHQDILLASDALLQVQEVQGHQFEELGSDDWYQGGGGFIVWLPLCSARFVLI